MTQNDHEKTRDCDTGVDASLARHGGLSYLEIPAIDPRQSATFYEKVLGWNLEWRAATIRDSATRPGTSSAGG